MGPGLRPRSTAVNPENHAGSNGSTPSKRSSNRLSVSNGISDASGKPSPSAESNSSSLRSSRQSSRSNSAANGRPKRAPETDQESTSSSRKKAASLDANEAGNPGEEDTIIDHRQYPIDAWAAALASLDREAYSRAIVADADSLFTNITFPMSFPWSHRARPIQRGVPCDIDEMDGIRNAASELSFQVKPSVLEQFKQTGTRLHGGTRTAIRRSADPGVLEWTTLTPHSLVKEAMIPKVSGNQINPSRRGAAEERTQLIGHREVVKRKRRLDAMEQISTKTRTISFRVGGSSSRSSLFDEAKRAGKTPMLLSAEMPSFYRDGIRKKVDDLDESDFALGSYDCGYGSTSNSDRVRSGRTRTIWAEKRGAFGTQQKLYHSFLTGEPVENGSHKRPLNVKVGVRVNGRLLCMPKDLDFSGDDEDEIDFVLEEACTPADVSVTNRQCSLDLAEFQARMYGVITPYFEHPWRRDASTAEYSVAFGRRGQKDICAHHNVPSFLCLPAVDGTVSVSCPEPGQIDTDDNISIHVLMDKVSAENGICSVCWCGQTLLNGRSYALLRCCKCSLTVHKNCYGSTRSYDRSAPWTCDPCFDLISRAQDETKLQLIDYKKNRNSTKCGFCRHVGGTLCKLSRGNWIHDLCWIFDKSQHASKPPSSGESKVQCALCGEYDRPIVRCAANHCKVAFHPICAAMVSYMARQYHHRYKSVEEDYFLSTQFSIALLSVNTTAGDSGISSVPVVFCGIHNPMRNSDRFGLYAEHSELMNPRANRLAYGAVKIPGRSTDDEEESEDDEESEQSDEKEIAS